MSESFSSIVMEEMMSGASRVLSWSSNAGSCGRGRQSPAYPAQMRGIWTLLKVGLIPSLDVLESVSDTEDK